MCPLLRFKLVADEIEWCKEYLKQNQCWRIMDISDRAIEEVAASIFTAYRTGKPA